MAMRSTRRGIISLLLACAVGGAIYSWLHRVELFVIPYRWREVRELYAACEAAEEEERARRSEQGDSEPLPERKAFDDAFCRLFELQIPEFDWGREFSFQEIRAEGGWKAYLVRYEPLDDEYLAEECTPKRNAFVGVDRRGRVLDDEAVRVLAGEGFVDTTCTRIVAAEGSFGEQVLHVGMCSGVEFRLSIDRGGVVFRGPVWGTPRVPLPRRFRARQSYAQDQYELPNSRVAALLASPFAGDVHRGLNALVRDWAPGLEQHVVALLEHADPDLRARAAAAAGARVHLATRVLACLDDPAPVVRVATAHTLAGSLGCDERVWRAADDPVREVRVHALKVLQRSEDVECALRAILGLLADDELPWSVNFAEGSDEAMRTPAVASALVAFAGRIVHGHLPRSLAEPYEREQQLTGLGWMLRQFPAEAVAPAGARLASVVLEALDRRTEAEIDPLLEVLSRLEQPPADRALLAAIEKGVLTDSCLYNDITGNLLRRRRPLADPRLLSFYRRRVELGLSRAEQGADASFDPSPDPLKLRAIFLLLVAGEPSALSLLERSLRVAVGEEADDHAFGFLCGEEEGDVVLAGALKTILDVAFEKPSSSADAFGYLLASVPCEALVAQIERLLRLYDRTQEAGAPRVELARLLTRLAHRDADALLATELEGVAGGAHGTRHSAAANAIFATALGWRGTCAELRLLRAVQAIASWNEDVFPVGWDEENGDFEVVDGPLVRRRTDETILWTGEDPIDWKLAAALLLERWGDPGANTRLLRLLRDHPDLRETDLWQTFGSDRAEERD